MVFEIGSGNQTKRWQLGEHYYVLVTGKHLDEGRPEALFADWYELGTPQGRWQDYRLLQVRTHDEVQWADFSASDFRKMEEAADALGLPSFEHHFRPRIRLIGGVLLAQTPGVGMVFPKGDPPYVEIIGVREQSVRLVLQREDGRTGEYRGIGLLYAQASSESRSILIELPEIVQTEGRYRICAGGDCVDFRLADSAVSVGTADPAELRLDLSLTNVDGHTVVSPNRHMLEARGDEYELRVEAWPGADLELRVAAAAGTRSTVLPVLAGSDGTWSATIEELPIPWQSPPDGDVLLEIGWRGLFTRRIVAEDEAYCDIARFEHELRRSSDATRYVFSCTGRVIGVAKDVSLYGYLLPSPPWQSPPRLFEVAVDGEGEFEGTVILDWQPVWFVLGDQRLLEQGDALIVGIRQLEERTSPARQRRPDEVDVARVNVSGVIPWHRLVRRVRQVEHPAGLAAYVRVAEVLLGLTQIRGFLTAWPSWKPITRWEDLVRELPARQRDAPVALFRKRISKGETAQATAQVRIEVSDKAVERGKVTFVFVESQPTVGGELVSAETRIVVVPNGALQACTKCNLVLPTAGFDGHVRPYVELPSCTALKKSLVPYTHGKPNLEDYVVVGVLLDPEKELLRVRANIDAFRRQPRSASEECRALIVKLKPLILASENGETWLAGLVDALDTLLELRRRVQSGRLIAMSELDVRWSRLGAYGEALVIVTGLLGFGVTAEPVVARQ